MYFMAFNKKKSKINGLNSLILKDKDSKTNISKIRDEMIVYLLFFC